MKIRRSTGAVWPVCIGFFVAIASGSVLWQIVARHLQPMWSAGVFVTSDFRFIFFFSSLFGLAAFLASRRLFQGPHLHCEEWTLSYPRIRPEPRGYRHVDE